MDWLNEKCIIMYLCVGEESNVMTLYIHVVVTVLDGKGCQLPDVQISGCGILLL